MASADDERIAIFLDYENLAIGAREALRGATFDFKPIADALAERGRVVVRRAYADWSSFDDDRRMLTRHNVELIEIPQRMGSVRKNAADIKMAVDAIEMCFERDYITTFVLCTGDSDFTPLMQKLRALNRSVIGIGIEASTSALLPPACDEFIFYERLEGVEPRDPKKRRSGRRRPSRGVADEGEETTEHEVEDDDAAGAHGAVPDLGVLVTQTLAGLERSSSGPVYASTLKRAILRKDPTFSESNYGYRGFGELLRNLAERGVVELAEGSAKGDPEVGFATAAPDEDVAFELLRTTVERLAKKTGGTPLSGLKNQLRKQRPDFTEKRFGYGGFLQFARAAQTRGVVDMDFDEDADDYILRPASATAEPAAAEPAATGAG